MKVLFHILKFGLDLRVEFWVCFVLGGGEGVDVCLFGFLCVCVLL